MNDDRLPTLLRLCREALARDGVERKAYLDSACGADTGLRVEIESLLAEGTRAVAFLETPPWAPAGTLAAGTRLGPYEVISLIGAGGMGQVYRARDTRLDRTVAVKILPSELDADDPGRLARFEREARTIAALNHPNICTLHDVGEQDGVRFLAMEHVEGQTLADLLRTGPLSIDLALRMAMEIADALAAAHRQHVIHRDLKPANIMVTGEGHVKVLDFGLAKHLHDLPNQETVRATVATSFGGQTVTQQGVVIGTVSYLSPEQAEGKPLDARTDVFSFGAVLYEMLTGRRAFEGESAISTMSAVLRHTPPRAGELRADVPSAFDAIVNRCLEKNPDLRYASAAELHSALAALHAQLAGQRATMRAVLTRPRFAIPAAAIVALLLALVSWQVWRSSRVQWARAVAMPEVNRLIDQQRRCGAFRLLAQAERYLPHDPEVARIRQNFMRRVSFRTDPPGADVYIRDYLATEDGEWEHLGRTPLEAALVPTGHLRYRTTKPGMNAVEGDTASTITGGLTVLEVKLDHEGTVPAGMIHVPAQTPVESFWLDKFEVTNRRFSAFIASGGYQAPRYWQHPFVRDGRTLTWAQAMGAFKDATGRPGPAAWQFGTFPEGQDEYPVGGVSWHEAAAFCEFEGKTLPTIHHWRRAATMGGLATILQVSNFAGQGPAPVGQHGGLGPFGTYDTAGNVREWCLNASGEKRYALGGAWNDPKYFYYYPDTRLPFDRSSGNGFRCARYDRPPSSDLTRPTDAALGLGPRGEVKPVGDDVFEIYRSLHAYERVDLESRVEAIDDTPPYWRLEKISFRAAYGNERVPAYVFLPRNATPPFQAVVTFPGTYAWDIRSSARLETQYFDFIVRSGRAVIHPVYQGSYERTLGGTLLSYAAQPSVWREMAIQWHKDVARSIDYLETRPDIDRERIAYHGISLGAAHGPRFMALEPRLKAGLLVWGGLPYGITPEISPANFTQRSRAPTLMINGRNDPIFPYETAQVPMFRLLGTPDADKRHFVVADGGHPALNQQVVQEILDWLDRYLGPVEPPRRD